MDLEQEIERISEELTDDITDGDKPFIPTAVRGIVKNKLHELSDIVAAFTRKQTLEEMSLRDAALVRVSRDVVKQDRYCRCDQQSPSTRPCLFCKASQALKALAEKGEEQPL